MSSISISHKDALAILKALDIKGQNGRMAVSLETLNAYRHQVHLATMASIPAILAHLIDRGQVEQTRAGYRILAYGTRVLRAETQLTGTGR